MNEPLIKFGREPYFSFYYHSCINHIKILDVYLICCFCCVNEKY